MLELTEMTKISRELKRCFPCMFDWSSNNVFSHGHCDFDMGRKRELLCTLAKGIEYN